MEACLSLHPHPRLWTLPGSPVTLFPAQPSSQVPVQVYDLPVVCLTLSVPPSENWHHNPPTFAVLSPIQAGPGGGRCWALRGHVLLGKSHPWQPQSAHACCPFPDPCGSEVSLPGVAPAKPKPPLVWTHHLQVIPHPVCFLPPEASRSGSHLPPSLWGQESGSWHTPWMLATHQLLHGIHTPVTAKRLPSLLVATAVTLSVMATTVVCARATSLPQHPGHPSNVHIRTLALHEGAPTNPALPSQQTPGAFAHAVPPTGNVFRSTSQSPSG